MERLARRVAHIWERYRQDFSGALLLARGEEVLFAAASGLANRDFGIPNALDTRFDTASVTKLFTASSVLQLVEQGALRLDERIADVIDLSGTAIPGDVTIRHLLTHTSGIADDADEEAGEDYAQLFVDRPNYRVRACRDFLPQFANKPAVFAAGTNVRYNNCAFILLGLAIEERTGADYRAHVAERVFARAGMARTLFQARDEVCPDTAEGYFAARDGEGNVVGWRKNIYSFPPIGTADSGAYTTVADLHRFFLALRNGTLLSPELSRQMFLPQCAFTRPNRHGALRFGYAMELIESGGRIVCACKDGLNAGVGAMASWYPVQRIGLFMLSNQDGPLWRMNGEMRAEILR